MTPRWSAIVTTSPRRDCTLGRCLDSMAACGWTPTIFAEPGSTHVDGYDVIQNSERLGAWHNWLRASRWALSQQSDLILTAQDDALFHPNSQEFIESIRWPRRAAFVSLYTPMHYTIDRKQRLQPTGVRKVATHNLWGALSLVWKPDTLAAVVNHPLVDSWLGVAPKRQDGERRDDYKKRTAAAFSDRRSDPSLIANIRHRHRADRQRTLVWQCGSAIRRQSPTLPSIHRSDTALTLKNAMPIASPTTESL